MTNTVTPDFDGEVAGVGNSDHDEEDADGGTELGR